MKYKPFKFIDIIETLPELDRQREHGITDAISTGWPHMDKFFTILKGQLNVVSGYPGMGKSQWVENIACNLAIDEQWNILMYCPESHPASKHSRDLIEKIVGKQMRADYNAPVMTENELSGAVFEIKQQFSIISADEEPSPFEEILHNISTSVKQGRKIDMVVIDPWNELESQRPANMTETDYIGKCLMNARRLARKLNISFWIVCHPAKPAQKNKEGDYEAPDLYDLAGSSHWFNKSDNGFIVHRADKTGTNAKVFVKKIKNRHYGQLGEVDFDFIPYCGRFQQPGKSE